VFVCSDRERQRERERGGGRQTERTKSTPVVNYDTLISLTKKQRYKLAPVVNINT